MNWLNKCKRLLLVPLVVVSILSLVGCEPNSIVIEKYSETVSQGLYAAGDALLHGRIDLAEAYIINLERIIPLPTTRIVITPVIYNGVHYVILNDREKGSKVIIVGDADFNNLLKIKAIQSAQQVAADKFQEQAIQQAKVDAQQISELVAENATLKNDIVTKDKEIAEYHASLEYQIKSWYHWIKVGSWFGIPLILIGTIVLCIFCPAYIPIVFNILGVILGVAWGFIKGFFSFIGSFFNTVSTK